MQLRALQLKPYIHVSAHKVENCASTDVVLRAMERRAGLSRALPPAISRLGQNSKPGTRKGRCDRIYLQVNSFREYFPGRVDTYRAVVWHPAGLAARLE